MRRVVFAGAVIGFTVLGSSVIAQVDQSKPIFELDCISFAGRGLANAPVKKKAYPGLAADGTFWSINPDTKRATITKIFPGEAAEKAGLEIGDEIVSVNGYPTEALSVRELFSAYHMYEPDKLTESIVVRKKDGTENSMKLQLLTLDKCNAEEKAAWLSMYKAWGY